ncbi:MULTISPECIES: hypothetical protein [unclassified Leptolyngbya]|uniref:hypothetical protein n=1 Tax=unclassified Leptolyngbya TaxID=2650499 RepID=UPI001684D8CC|nr:MULTISPECIES: hypothetical protein [unclassified Leptolyngbya]MBD1909121.1 hypothetical protein [Leptolyngbya sp. FACHB-8]MBD2157494.1 hypothetical protein [Leptolyngbya sp. FACHB-16]
MASTLTVSGKVMGKTQPIFTNWQLRLEIENAITLRDLLTQIVRSEVAGFQDRQQQRRLIQVLSPAQISLGVEQGKVDLGGSDLAQEVDVDEAIATALQAFTDGLYFVFLDEQQQGNLDDVVTLQPNSQLLFLRLVPLVGG